MSIRRVFEKKKVSEKKKRAWKDEGEEHGWKKGHGSDPGDQRSHKDPSGDGCQATLRDLGL